MAAAPDKDATAPDTVPNPTSPPPTARPQEPDASADKGKVIPETKDTKKVSSSSKDVVAIFCKRTGYESDQILSHNEKTRTFVTTNGGKYQLTARGVRHLSGPTVPKALEDED